MKLTSLKPTKFFLAKCIHAILNKIDILRSHKFRKKISPTLKIKLKQ